MTEAQHDDVDDLCMVHELDLLILQAEHDRYRDALTAIGDGRWNVDAPRDLDVREFARKALDG